MTTPTTPTTPTAERGSILILTALSLTVLLGIAALSIDASLMYDTRNQLAAAADAAAKSVATEIHRQPLIDAAGMQAFAAQQVATIGLVPGPCGSTTLGVSGVCVQRPPTGIFAGEPNYVEVRVAQPTATYFGRVLGWLRATPSARAVAGTSHSSHCVVALGPTSPGIHIGMSTITMPGCTLVDNTDLDNGGTITAQGIDALTCSNGCAGVTVNVPGTTDPLLGLAPPDDPGGACIGGPGPLAVGGTLSITAGKYCGWDLDNNAILHLGAGIYYLTGPVTAKNDVQIDGTGVTIYLAVGASFVIDKNNPILTLSAPTSDPFRAILFYQDRLNTTAAQLGKNSGQMILSGAMYFPAADVTTAKNNGVGIVNDCALFVAKSLDMKNNADLSNACAAYGGSPLQTVSMAE